MKSGLIKTGLILTGAIFTLASTALCGDTSLGMPKAPHYRPLTPGAPKVRVDGRLRGADDALLTLTVLAPEHVGLTTQAQPCLYWYQSKASKARFELTIMERKGVNPLLEVGFQDATDDVIQCICLAKYNIELKTGVEYRWTVSMVVDPENRSKDVIASGMIKRVTPPETLTSRLAVASVEDRAYVYADEGMWYDSLDALSKLIDEKPGDKKLHEVRSVYFMQAGLPEAARHEMKMASVKAAVKTEK
jgi:hypothetical protein